MTEQGPALPAGGVISVALVDDHRMFAESLARLLGSEPDIEVVAQASTAAAVPGLLDRHEPHVVLLDHGLPDASGVDVARQIKSLRPDTMVVMITGSGDDRILLAAIDAGCSGFLTKDRTAGEVAHAVRAAALGEVVVPPALLARLLPQLGVGAALGLGGDLSPRERQVLDAMASGATNRAIGAELFLSVNTVRNHVQQVLLKLGAHSKLEAVAIAVREGIVTYRS